MLQLLAQVLIKVHAGREWGANEEGVRNLTTQADDLAKKLMQPPST